MGELDFVVAAGLGGEGGGEDGRVGGLGLGEVEGGFVGEVGGEEVQGLFPVPGYGLVVGCIAGEFTDCQHQPGGGCEIEDGLDDLEGVLLGLDVLQTWVLLALKLIGDGGKNCAADDLVRLLVF